MLQSLKEYANFIVRKAGSNISFFLERMFLKTIGLQEQLVPPVQPPLGIALSDDDFPTQHTFPKCEVEHQRKGKKQKTGNNKSMLPSHRPSCYPHPLCYFFFCKLKGLQNSTNQKTCDFKKNYFWHSNITYGRMFQKSLCLKQVYIKIPKQSVSTQIYSPQISTTAL